MKHKILALSLITMFLFPATAFAQTGPSAADLSIWLLLSTIVYGAIGIVLCVTGYLIFDKIIGLDLQRELVEDQNVALGVMLAGVFIGIAIVVGAVMLS